MRRLTQTPGGRLAAMALCVALVLAVCFWVPDSLVRGFGALVVTVAVLLGVIAIIADACIARPPAALDDGYELSTLAFPPPEPRGETRDHPDARSRHPATR